MRPPVTIPLEEIMIEGNASRDLLGFLRGGRKIESSPGKRGAVLIRSAACFRRIFCMFQINFTALMHGAVRKNRNRGSALIPSAP